jgi:hypothetical protein
MKTSRITITPRRDTRTSGYRAQFGTDECWELDALDPTVIDALIRDELDELIDPAAWRKAFARERRERKQLDAVAAKWIVVQELLRGKR